VAPSRSRRPTATFGGQALALAAGAWSELGVSGWTSTHRDWGIDPEPLILFTAWLGDADPRLRDEATDWCIRSWRYVSKARLKNLLREQPGDVRQAFGEFSATVATHAGTPWPGGTEPRPYEPTGRSTLPPLQLPSLAWLRLRAMFGVGARAEILRCLLSREGEQMTVARLAALTGYTKRNVADECDSLRQAGVLSVRTRGNRLYYALARPSELRTFVGELPAVRPDWTAMLDVARELLTLEQLARDTAAEAVAVHARSTLRRMEGNLDELGIEPPRESIRGADLWPALQRFAMHHVGSWSVGQWPSPAEQVAAR
jgi:hypothetical protein